MQRNTEADRATEIAKILAENTLTFHEAKSSLFHAGNILGQKCVLTPYLALSDGRNFSNAEDELIPLLKEIRSLLKLNLIRRWSTGSIYTVAFPGANQEHEIEPTIARKELEAAGMLTEELREKARQINEGRVKG